MAGTKTRSDAKSGRRGGTKTRSDAKSARPAPAGGSDSAGFVAAGGYCAVAPGAGGYPVLAPGDSAVGAAAVANAPAAPVGAFGCMVN